MSLITKYEEAVARQEIYDDPRQREVLQSLQAIADDLDRPKHAWFKRWHKSEVKGLYLYGPVGGGKTFLMDLFYRHVKERHKARIHFHQFMQQVDGELRRLQGHADPLKAIAAKLARTTRLLCLDEFLVQDIATAMILAELLQYLFAAGIVLVLTSNTAPDNLYLNGLQRVRFLPAIALIKQHCKVISIVESRDYRLGRAPLAKAYLHPLNETTDALMLAQFNALVKTSVDAKVLSIQGRDILTKKWSENVVWFEFDVICYLPRSQLDYLEIAQDFHTIFLSNVPVLSAQDTVRALLFTHFIDVMYDRRIRVVISAAVPIDELYLHGEVSVEFQRTRSRLQEMQSVDYLS